MFSLKILLNIELFGIWKAIIIPPLENFLFNLFKLKMHRKNKTFDSLSAGSRVRYYMRGVSIPILISTVTSWLTLFVDNLQFSSVQSLSHVWLFATTWTAARQASLSITNSWSLLKLMSIESVMPSNHLILCCPLLLLPSIFPSKRVFSNESVLCITWPKYWSFSFSISPSNEYLGLISFRMDWFDLFADQGTLKSIPQHHNAKASFLQHSAFFIVQLSHPHFKTPSSEEMEL